MFRLTQDDSLTKLSVLVLNVLCIREGNDDRAGIDACLPPSCTADHYLDATCSDTGIVLCAEDTQNSIIDDVDDR